MAELRGQTERMEESVCSEVKEKEGGQRDGEVMDVELKMDQ